MKSLVLPFLFWNFVWTAFDVICSYSPLHQFFIGRGIISLSPEELLSRIILGTHSPFWFIRVIIIFTLSCPIIFTLIKNRYIGLGSIVIVYALYANGISLPEQDPFFFRGDSIVFYLIGAYIGRHHFNTFSTRRTFMVARFSLVMFVACCFVNICFAGTMHPAWTVPIWSCQAILLWIAFDNFKNNHYYRFEMDSFLVFAMHVNVSAVVAKLLFIALPKAPVFAGINYCFTIIGTLMIVCCFSMVVDRCPSSIQRLTRGGR